MAILIGMDIIFNETITSIKLLESSNVFLSDGIRIVLSHAKRMFRIKEELQNNEGVIMKDYFEYERTNHSSTSKQILDLVNIYLKQYLKMFIHIFIKNDNNSDIIMECEDFENFMLLILYENIDVDYFKIFVSENKEYFNLELEKCDEYLKLKNDKNLEYQVVSPTTCNEESLFSTMKHHYHPNCNDKTIESTTTCSFEMNDMGSLCWYYKKQYLLEEYFENIERRRSK